MKNVVQRSFLKFTQTQVDVYTNYEITEIRGVTPPVLVINLILFSPFSHNATQHITNQSYRVHKLTVLQFNSHAHSSYSISGGKEKYK